MKKAFLLMCTVFFSASGFSEEEGTVTVKGNRVSLRAAPALTAVLLGRAMLDDQLVLADDSNPEWAGVRPPSSVNLWVHSEYVADGIVKPARLNVRSGPSLNHSVVAVVERGDEVKVRAELGGWLKIVPPPGSVAWISRKYVEIKRPQQKVRITIESPRPKIEPPEAVVKITVPAEPAVVVAEPTLEDMLMELSGVSGIPEKLAADPDKEQGVEESFTGCLLPTESILFKLVDAKVEEVLHCYVRGNRLQMTAYQKLPVRLTGKAYWVLDLEMPMLVPDQLEILSE